MSATASKCACRSSAAVAAHKRTTTELLCRPSCTCNHPISRTTASRHHACVHASVRACGPQAVSWWRRELRRGHGCTRVPPSRSPSSRHALALSDNAQPHARTHDYSGLRRHHLQTAPAGTCSLARCRLLRVLRAARSIACVVTPAQIAGEGGAQEGGHNALLWLCVRARQRLHTRFTAVALTTCLCGRATAWRPAGGSSPQRARRVMTHA